MPNLRSSLIITFFASNGVTVIGFMLSMVLARLLSPEEIGIFSIAFVLVAIAQLFRDFGVGSYLIREKELTPAKIRAASGVLFASSWIAAGALYLLSSAAANYYNRLEVKNVIEVLALGFVFIPFGAVTHTLLTRELRAKDQAIATMIATVVSSLSSIVLAYSGFSYMTMAWANLINIIVSAIALSPFRPKNAPWLPSIHGWRRVTSFGMGALLSNSIQAVNATIPDIVLGKVSGAPDVGIYSRGSSTTNIFGQIVGPTVSYAVLPVLAKKHHAGESLSEPLSKGVAYLSAIAWPAFLVTGIFAREIILVLYGEKWLDCVPVVQILCIAAALNTPFNFNGAATMAIGRPYLSAVPGMTAVAVKLSMIAIIFNGTLISFAYAMLTASAVNCFVHLWLQSRYLGFRVEHFFKSFEKSALILAFLSPGVLFLHHIMLDFWPLIQLLTVTVFIAPAWVFLARWTSHPVTAEFKSISDRYPVFRWLLHGNG